MNRIPKIIHYCWFGGNPLSELAQKCIASWRKYCPDYEIKEWNETNFDVHCCRFVEQAYEAKKWAFVADYARFYAMYTEGGVYFDTDIELIKPVDDLLEHGAFFGFGPQTMVASVFGTEKNAQVAKQVINRYEQRSFLLGHGYNLITSNQTLFSVLTEEYGLIHNNRFQELKEGIAVYPKEYFFSTDWQTGIITKTPELYVIHYADGSWLDDDQRMHIKIRRRTISIFGERLGGFLGDTWYLLKRDGWRQLLVHGKRYLLRTLGPAYMRMLGRLRCDRKKVVFENFAGRGYGDNPKYIAKELLLRDKGYDLVWIVRSGSNYQFPKGIRTVEAGTWRELYELATAKFWVDNNRKAAHIVKNKRQRYIQTWHGFYPLKKIEKDAEMSLSAAYVKSAKHDASMTDLMISGCKVRTRLYQSSFWYKGEIAEWGTPRNDIFFDGTNYKETVRSHFGIDPEKKVVLYAPTFRDDHSVAAYDLDYARLLKNVEEKFGGSWVCFIRLHPAVREMSQGLSYPENCVDASSYDDIQELFSASDLLITDYSDCMFEYTLTKRPVILYASDIDTYVQGRGFYYDIHDLPYPIVTDNDGLSQIILSFDEVQYQEKIEAFLKEIESYERGEASKLTVDYIIEHT